MKNGSCNLRFRGQTKLLEAVISSEDWTLVVVIFESIFEMIKEKDLRRVHGRKETREIAQNV